VCGSQRRSGVHGTVHSDQQGELRIHIYFIITYIVARHCGLIVAPLLLPFILLQLYLDCHVICACTMFCCCSSWWFSPLGSACTFFYRAAARDWNAQHTPGIPRNLHHHPPTHPLKTTPTPTPTPRVPPTTLTPTPTILLTLKCYYWWFVSTVKWLQDHHSASLCYA
jgi:hypothetical protein